MLIEATADDDGLLHSPRRITVPLVANADDARYDLTTTLYV
jgi:hypothetical protein